MHLVVVGGSDAGISAALRARELSPETDVTVVVADSFPNFSICGIPYHVAGDVPRWQSLAHRGVPELEATGMRLRLDTPARAIDPTGRRLTVDDGAEIPYDELVIGTGAVPIRPSIGGLDRLGPADGVFLLHSMADTFALTAALETGPASALIVGAGYIGVEMVEALTAGGLQVTQVEALPEVLPTVDPELGELVRQRIEKAGAEVVTGVTVSSIRRHGQLIVEGSDSFRREVDLVLVVVGVRPDTALARTAGVDLGVSGAIAVDRSMRTNVPHVWAAGDCVVTHHRLLGQAYLPLGTTAHKQGRVAGENAVGGSREYAGSLGSQVVKVFDLVVGRTGLRDAEARAAGFRPRTVAVTVDDHKAYYPGAEPIAMRWTGDVHSGRLLGAQFVGRLGSEIAKRVDIAATAIHCGLSVDQISDLDLTYTPPLGSPWDAVQIGAQAWERPRCASPAGSPPRRSARGCS
jgi:NADPH-dependent 2,4-dienoyl-CoA reductase/sulfur reductase-like enzyme